jgi:hypothetical protein
MLSFTSTCLYFVTRCAGETRKSFEDRWYDTYEQVNETHTVSWFPVRGGVEARDQDNALIAYLGELA